ncbi:hypothetical protein HY990_06540 [Candidatus Micrarchaeota archaeon]|nr:hypothetical protein [Candidatus Micrarchaeota archaeon]
MVVDANTISSIITSTRPAFWTWVPYSALAIGASVSILTLIYVWASIMRNPNLTAYVKQEIYELFASVFIMVIVFSLLGAMTYIKVGTILPMEYIPGGIDQANDNIYHALSVGILAMAEDVKGWLELNYLMNMYVDQSASVTPYARPMGVGLTVTPLAGFASPIKSVLYNMTSGLAVSYIVTVAQFYVYVFFIEAFLKYYLPIGLFLRCFTPTRRLGGTLIAISVSFLFLFPVLALTTFTTLYSAHGPLVSFRGMLTNYFHDNGNFVDNMSDFFHNNFTGGFTDLVSGVFGAIGQAVSTVFGGTFLVLMLFPISTMAFAFIIAFVAPTFNVLVFTQATRGLSAALGEEVDISSLTRLI